MRTASIGLLGILLLSLVPLAGAQATYVLEADKPAEIWVNVGNGANVTFTVRQAGGAPVQGALVSISWVNSVTIPSGSDGTVFATFHNNAAPGAGSHTITARVDGPSGATSNVWQATIHFTAVDFALTAPAGPHEPGAQVPVTLSATWRHDNVPIPGVKVQLVAGTTQAITTGSDGKAQATVTRASEGTLQVAANLLTADRPNGIWEGAKGPWPVVFGTSDGGNGEGDSGSSGGGDSGSGSGGGSGGSGGGDGSGTSGGDSGSGTSGGTDQAQSGTTDPGATDPADPGNTDAPAGVDPIVGSQSARKGQGERLTPWPMACLLIIPLAAALRRRT